MRKLGSIIITLSIVVILVIIEIIIIKGASRYEPQTDIVFAKVRIPEKTLITMEMLEIKKININMAHKLALVNIKDALGRPAGMDIEAGEALLSSKLGYEGMEKIVVKDKDKRLFSVEFKGDQANGWWLMADQLVDIIYVPDTKNEQDTGRESNSITDDSQDISQIKIENKILKIKNIRIAALIDGDGKLLKNKDRNTIPKYISFEVSQEEADFLAYAKGNGRLEISLIPDQD
jgi:hypothetical protein